MAAHIDSHLACIEFLIKLFLYLCKENCRIFRWKVEIARLFMKIENSKQNSRVYNLKRKWPADDNFSLTCNIGAYANVALVV